MQLQIAKNNYRQNAPPFAGSKVYPFKIESADIELKSPETGKAPTELPVLANANDLREAVKFFKHKPQGVSVIELLTAEPRRVFDARKIAAYEFWGVLARSEDRLQLTALGAEIAKNTETECALYRQILWSIAPYLKALEWVSLQKLKIATHFDIAGFWEKERTDFSLSIQNEENIEAVVVSFFSLCHAAEIGTATIGKRGQPARLNIHFEQLKEFLESAPDSRSFPPILALPGPKPVPPQKLCTTEIERVYISAGKLSAEIENLHTALELADFESCVFDREGFENGFLPAPRLGAMKQCQASIFLLDETDCVNRNDLTLLHCDRVVELSIAEALFADRIAILWMGRKKAPDIFGQFRPNIMKGENLGWEAAIQLVKYLKNLRRN